MNENLTDRLVPEFAIAMCSGGCAQGRRSCPVPEACEISYVTPPARVDRRNVEWLKIIARRVATLVVSPASSIEQHR